VDTAAASTLRRDIKCKLSAGVVLFIPETDGRVDELRMRGQLTDDRRRRRRRRRACHISASRT